jgi:hypothetical protein
MVPARLALLAALALLLVGCSARPPHAHHAMHDSGLCCSRWARSEMRTTYTIMERVVSDNTVTLINRGSGSGSGKVTVDVAPTPSRHYQGPEGHWDVTNATKEMEDTGGQHHLVSFELETRRFIVLRHDPAGGWSVANTADFDCSPDPTCAACGAPDPGIRSGSVAVKLRSPVVYDDSCLREGVGGPEVVGAREGVPHPTESCRGTETGDVKYVVFETDGPDLVPRCSGSMRAHGSQAVQVSVDDGGRFGQPPWVVVSSQGWHEVKPNHVDADGNLVGFTRAGVITP